jgi:hypothetical protein
MLGVYFDLQLSPQLRRHPDGVKAGDSERAIANNNSGHFFPLGCRSHRSTSANAYPLDTFQIGGLGLLRGVQVPPELEIHPQVGRVPKNLASRKAVAGVIPRRPFTSPLTRRYGTRSPQPAPAASGPSGSETPPAASRQDASVRGGLGYEPCHTLGISLIVIVNDRDIRRSQLRPDEAHPVLISSRISETLNHSAIQTPFPAG